jgi:hypothetical protein
VIGFELLDREYRESNATYLTFPGVLSRTRDMFLEAVLSTPVRDIVPKFCFVLPCFSGRPQHATHVHADGGAFCSRTQLDRSQQYYASRKIFARR